MLDELPAFAATLHSHFLQIGSVLKDNPVFGFINIQHFPEINKFPYRRFVKKNCQGWRLDNIKISSICAGEIKKFHNK